MTSAGAGAAEQPQAYAGPVPAPGGSRILPQVDEPLPFDPIAEARRNWDARWSGGAVMAAVTSIMRAQQLLIGEINALLKPLGLTFARYEVLVLLSFTRSGAMPLGRMGRRLMVHPASITNAVDRLERTELVRRVPHPEDGRATLAEITDEGREVMIRATDVLVGAEFGAGALSAAQLAQLTEVLTTLRVAAGDFVPEGAEAGRAGPQRRSS